MLLKYGREKKIVIINGQLLSSLAPFLASYAEALLVELLLSEWALNDAFENLLTREKISPELFTNDDDNDYC